MMLSREERDRYTRDLDGYDLDGDTAMDIANALNSHADAADKVIQERDKLIGQLVEAVALHNGLVKACVLGSILGLPCKLSTQEIEERINAAVDKSNAALAAAGRK